MKVAIIDIGTNTINLIIAEQTSNRKSYVILHNAKIAAHLGAGGIHKQTITEDAFERGFKALENHLQTIASYNVDKTFAFATASLRLPQNGELFAQGAKDLFDLDIEIISGQREAQFIYEGVKQVVEIQNPSSLIMDIGGGSIEFILCNKESVQWLYSFNVGVSLLKETFQPHNPILQKEIQVIKTYLEEELAPLWEAAKIYPTQHLIGASGSFDTLSNILQNKNITPKELKQLLQELLETNHEQRAAIPGMDSTRVEYMPLASIVIALVLEKLNIQEIQQSPYALKEGAVEYILQT